MNFRYLLLVALLLVLPISCKSTSTEVPCTCGTPMGDLEGCAHPLCVAGKHNPANPDCVCGTIEIKPAKKEH
jgi:hypothetical protein